MSMTLSAADRCTSVLIASLLSMVWSLVHIGQALAADYETSTGKTIRITESHPVGLSLSTIRITSQGFEHEFDETLEDADPITDVFLADLNGDGFDEIYIITVAAGSGSYGSVIGVASNRDRSLSMINFPDTGQGDPMFEGYMGHDAFSIQSQRLVRAFPVYLATDTNAGPTGGTRRVVYALKPGEAMWQLQIERVESAGRKP